MSESLETQVVFVQDQTHHGTLPGKIGLPWEDNTPFLAPHYDHFGLSLQG